MIPDTASRKQGHRHSFTQLAKRKKILMREKTARWGRICSGITWKAKEWSLGLQCKRGLALTATSLMWGGKGKARALFAAIYSTIKDLGKDSCLHRQIYQWAVVAILLLLLLWGTERMSSQMNLSMASHSFIILVSRKKHREICQWAYPFIHLYFPIT